MSLSAVSRQSSPGAVIVLPDPCFHCGEPVPDGSRHSAMIAGAARPMCCAGCAAVAQTIADNRLADYYESRASPPRREYAAAGLPPDLAAYDEPEIQARFVRDAGGGVRQAALLVEGITCGACVWLIERRLARLDGVRCAAVNLAARRVQVEWIEGRARLSEVLHAISALGYRTQGFDAQAGKNAAARERRAMLWRLFVAGFGMMQVMMYASPSYFAADDLSREAEQLMRWASLVLTLPVVLWSAGPFFAGAWRGLRARRADMDLPVALGIAIAFAASARAVVAQSGEVYFDSITMFVFLLLGARWLEALVRERAADAQQRLGAAAPAMADRLVPGAAGATERVPVARLAPGDRVEVATGNVIPADGRVTSGRSAADESLLTGESRPVAKAPGDAVVGGSVNVSSPIVVEVARVGQDTVLAGIVRLMDRAQAGRPRIAQLADRVAQWFVAALIVVAAVTAAIWYFVDPQRALWIMAAVLVVSCPCALSLATPAALAAATGTLHRMGVLVTRGHALETLSRVTHVVFDKTGTLTQGRLALAAVLPLGALDRDACLALAAALERGSGHAIGRALRKAAESLPPVATGACGHSAGFGVESTFAGKRVRLGSPAFVRELVGRPLPDSVAAAADEMSVAALADEGGYLALFTLSDLLRDGARALVRDLQAAGLTVCMLSGDRERTVAHYARALGIGLAVGGADPKRKLAFVRDLQSRGAVVAMVGDGVNDAPVLAQAQVSIAMSGGADLAQAGSDIVFLGEDVGRLGKAFGLARDTLRIIRQNLAWAVAYNAVAIPLAAAGWVTPLAAGAGMAASSLAVVANALRLCRAGAARTRAQAEPESSHEPRAASRALQRKWKLFTS